MNKPALKIRTLAKLTGTSTPTIRYYEQIGLLPHRPDRWVASEFTAKVIPGG